MDKEKKPYCSNSALCPLKVYTYNNLFLGSVRCIGESSIAQHYIKEYSKLSDKTLIRKIFISKLFKRTTLV